MICCKKKIVSLFLIFSLFIGLAGLMNIDTAYAATNKIHLRKATVSVAAGKTYQQKLISKSGKTIKATSVKWKSAKTSIAKITRNGKITAVKAGTVKMTAKYKGKTYRFTVKVTRSSSKASAKSTSGTVYWTPSGTVYHKSKGCPTLARSKIIYHGTIRQSGKSRCCKVCG